MLLLMATFSSLTFPDQKNGVRGEVIDLSHSSGDSQLSPPRILVRRVIHFRHHNAPVDTAHLSRVYMLIGRIKSAKPADIKTL